MFAFGPVPSRRLGRSIGINHVPPKICTYSCVYCQVGRTSRLHVARRAFYAEEGVVTAVSRQVEAALAAGERIDYLTFVPDGEPTLDLNLASLIRRLRPLGVKIAVISNGSLLWRADVREALTSADWVSVKVDAVHPAVWRRINRPHRSLWLAAILEGMLTFAQDYRGELATETMLVGGVNDDIAHVDDIADFLAQMRPAKAYLAVPTRPPTEPWAAPPPEDVINRAFQQLNSRLQDVELLIGYEGNAFASTGALADDLMSITAVHPMREDAVKELLLKTGADTADLRALVEAGQLVETKYAGHRFYSRRLKGMRVHGQTRDPSPR